MDKFTIPVLKLELEKRDLPTRGSKVVLADRLREAIEAEGNDPGSYVSEFVSYGSGNKGRKFTTTHTEELVMPNAGEAEEEPRATEAAAADETSSARSHLQHTQGDDGEGDGEEDDGDGGEDAGDEEDPEGAAGAEHDHPGNAAEDVGRARRPNYSRRLRDDAASVCSKRSVGSRGSSASTGSATLLKMEEAAKRAELQVRASFLEERRQLEDEELQDQLEQMKLKLRNRRKREDLELKTKMAEADARERAMIEVELDLEGQDVQQPRTQVAPHLNTQSVPARRSGRLYNQPACNTAETPSTAQPHPGDGGAHDPADGKFSRSDTGKRNERTTHLTGLDTPGHKVNFSTKLERLSGASTKEHQLPQSLVQRDRTSDDEAVLKQSSVLDLLLEQQDRNLLPKLDVPRFSGSVTDYAQFIRSFEVRIESKLRNDDERLSYLDHYLVGEPKDVIKGCLLMTSGSGYAEARRLLDGRYGDSCRTVTSLVSRLSKWPQIRSDDVTGLDKFSIFLNTCHHTVQGTAPSSVELDQPNILRAAMDKLPDYMQDRWRRHALKISSNKETPSSNAIRFVDFVNFVQAEVKILLDPLFGKHSTEARSTRAVQPKPNPRTMTGSVLATNASTGPKCWYCEGSHYLQDCTILRAKPIDKRREYFMKESLCFGCCRRGHRVAQCRSRRSCELCNRRHLTVLHQSVERADPSSVTTSSAPDRAETRVKERFADAVSAASKIQSGMPVVPVKVRAEGGRTVSTYAFLDSGSSACFCTESLLAELQASSETTHLTLETVNPQLTKLESSVVLGLQVADIEESSFIRLPPVYSLSKLPVCKQDVPKPEDLKKWPHLDEVDMKDLESDVGLMIGSNVPEAIEPWKVLHGKPGDPFAVQTKLGWTVWGATGNTDNASQNIRFNRVKVEEAAVHELFVKMYNEEYKDDVSDKKGMSQEDVAWMEKVTTSCKPSNDGHYQIALPFRSSKPKLPDNRQMAHSRLKPLKRKLSADRTLHQQYSAFMKDMLDHKYAERVPDSELTRDDGLVWYIPHHGVRHPEKPDKVRVVFDCPAKFHDVSLNDSLLQGPDLTNDLLDVLLKFRENEVAFTADIEAMFYQVRVPEDDRDFLRFLWWPDGDLSNSPATYRMTVHLFGASSSPSCANFALRKTAEDHGNAYRDHVSKTIRENFYVDDCLKSTSDVDEAISLAHDLKDLCRRGGFNLAKIVSNDRKVLNSFAPENLGKNLQSVDLSCDKLPEGKALGVYWNVEEDVLGLKISDVKRPTTRRGVLSTIGSVFDPLGLAAPFLLEGRMLLQDLCRLELGWDQPLPHREEVMWQNWLRKLPETENLRLRRCIVPQHFGQVVDAQLHHFADASESGIGVVSYVRLTNQRGEVHCSFLQGKSRVAPLKAVTIPRLELTAAVLAAKMSKRLEETLEMVPSSVTFWSDSTTVLSYIKNTKTRFHIFVANRMKVIHERSSPAQWRYVPGEKNPADEGSRGYQTARWLEGPRFLWKDESAWPVSPLVEAVKTDDPEVKVISCATNEQQSSETVSSSHQSLALEICERFSSWHKAKKAVAWMLRFKTYILSKRSAKKGNTKVETGPLLVSELADAEAEIIRHVQEQHFGQEMQQRREDPRSCVSGTETVRVKKSSRLKKLNPMMENGLLRVGGRLRKSTLNHDMKHPMILPNTGHVPRLVVEDVHQRLGHQGREHVLGTLREKFWIVQGTSLVRKVLRKCVVCRKLMSPPVSQKMADLPEERVVSDRPPFTNSGVDLFGPFYVKRGRAEVKLYGVVFTCMASRAIHLEVADSLSTSAFINVLRRFIARRGEIKSLRSDRGTNFIGAERELAEMIKEWNEGQVVETMLQAGVQWIFNPPGASHFGGVWERQIRTIRKILTATLSEQTIREDNLRTLLCEIEAIVNSRPLTKVSMDPQDAAPLTPNHLLHHGSGAFLPPGLFQPDDTYSRRWWKQVQYLADLFWKRWRKEYLTNLQQRHKWTKTRKNIKVDDIVILVDENLPRSQWRLGKVEEVHPSSDGLVRKVKVRAGQSSLDRPLSKVVLVCDD